jgi:hypothetical protein
LDDQAPPQSGLTFKTDRSLRAASLGGLFTFELFASVMSAFGDIVAKSQNALLLIFQ